MLAAAKTCANEPQKCPWKDRGVASLEAAGGCQQRTLPRSGAGLVMPAVTMGGVGTCSVGDASCPSAWQLRDDSLKTINP